MKLLRKALFALLCAATVTLLIVGLGGGDDKQGSNQEPAKPVAQLTTNKTPEPIGKVLPAKDTAAKDTALKETIGKEGTAKDNAAKESLTKNTEKTPFKPISMAEAVTIAEKIGKGQATKAERKDRPALIFKIDVMSWDGKLTKVELSADGKVINKK